jgi:hypothetical protein
MTSCIACSLNVLAMGCIIAPVPSLGASAPRTFCFRFCSCLIRYQSLEMVRGGTPSSMISPVVRSMTGQAKLTLRGAAGGRIYHDDGMRHDAIQGLAEES